MTQRILLVGANGFIGNALLHELLTAGHQVTACVRHPKSLHGRYPVLPLVVADYTTHQQETDWLPLVKGFDVVINSVGVIREQGKNSFEKLHASGPIALFDACVAAGVRCVVQISALGACANNNSRFLESKCKADSHLLTLPLDSYVIRPSLVYGDGGKSSLLFKAIAALPFIPLPGSGEQQVQPVTVTDLSRIVVACIEGRVEARQVVNVVGREPLSLRQMFTKYRAWLGLSKPRFISLPEKPLLYAAHRLGYFGLQGTLNEMRSLLHHGNTASVSRLAEQSGITPHAMDVVLQQSPAQPSDRWHARLYLLRPLLRFSLALLWIWTAVVSLVFFPFEQSMSMVTALGVPATWAPSLIYTASALDLLLGLALLCNRYVRTTAIAQIAVILIYTTLITLFLPHYWLHPFGPVSKNLPLLIATLMLIAMED